jgi:hypothetical protein
MVNGGFGKIGVGGRGDEVHAWPYEGISAIVSRTDQHAFERNEENVLAHQRVIQKIFSRFAAVPLPFSTILESETELENFLASRRNEFRDKLVRLREIVEPISPVPGSELVEETFVQSHESALRIRQLADEASKLRAISTAKADQSSMRELACEVRSLREELQALRHIDELLVPAVGRIKAATAAPGEASRDVGGNEELVREFGKLRDELKSIKMMQSNACDVKESAEKLMKELMERIEAARKSSTAPPICLGSAIC